MQHLGHATAWTGNNHVGHTTPQATQAEQAIGKLCIGLPQSNELSACSAGEWLSGSVTTYGEMLEFCGIDTSASTKDIVTAATTCVDNARLNGILIRGGVGAVFDTLVKAVEHERGEIAEATKTHRL